jgi:nitrite reductase (NADH) large subunit
MRPMPVAYLRVRGRGAPTETVTFKDELTIGRAWRADDPALQDTKMSRRHAQFTIADDGTAWVEDLGSMNGTFVNGKRIEGRQRLRLGDEVRLSVTTFELTGLTTGGGETVADEITKKKPERPKKPPKPSLIEVFKEQRTKRAALPPFPNYTTVPSLLSVRTWWTIRYAGVLATLTVVVLCFVDKKLGLKIVWDFGIPLLPILFFVAPGLWRNICPLAASNQTPRIRGWTKALNAPGWLKKYGYAISITGFFIFISLRKIGLQTNGPLTGALLLFALASGFSAGMFLKGKSGWCSSICPLLPVQRLYGQTPFALVTNTHCQPCVGCTKNCFDFNPRVAFLADLNDSDPTWYAGRKFFAAAFPGLVLGFFKVGNHFVEAGTHEVSIGHVYGRWALYIGASVLSFYAIESVTKVAAHKLTTLYAAAAINIFYWLGLPEVYKGLTGNELSSAVRWIERGVLGALTLFWIYRTYAKEKPFREQASGGAAGGGGGGAGSASIIAYRASKIGKPEITFLPDDKKVVAEPGQTLLELAEANGLQIEAGCRMGVCGADPVAIKGGMENLSSMTDDERATLERLGFADNTRMACCCRVKGPAAVGLKPEEAGAVTPSRLLAMKFNREVERVVVIGNGIAGISAADYVRRNHPECSIDVIAEEAYELYNRMAITRLIYGRSAMHGLQLNPDSWCESRNITLWLNTRASGIDRSARKVSIGTTEELAYDRLILATGSASFVPAIGGWGAPGTYALRTAADALDVRAFAQINGARTAIVAGGGLLGLEAAYALHKLGLQTTVLERSERLLRRQLDDRAGELLTSYLERLGISIVARAETESVSGNGRIHTVNLKDGRSMPGEILIAAAGITPNIDLAAAAGLETKKGVIVDDHMRTNDELIYAAGDVAEFRGQIAGLWPAAVEQAKVAAEAAVLDATGPYTGTVPVTVLKVVGVDLTSLGRIELEPGDEQIVQEEESSLRYGKLIIAGGRIVGAILLGYTSEVAFVTSAVKQGWDVSHVLNELREGRWDVLENVGKGRSLSAVSVVGG